VIKQFNFYDIYGYLLPGMLLLGILWAPVAMVSHSLPSKDLSEAVFVAALTYIVGHLVRVVSSSLVPSTIVLPGKAQRRVMSDYLLDKSCPIFAETLKTHLQQQVQDLFQIALHVDQDGDGEGALTKDRNIAFFQARSYLIAKSSAAYVEQFEGMYSMMRGLGCCFYVGAAYFAGWGISLHPTVHAMSAMNFVTLLGVCGTLGFSLEPKAKSYLRRLAAICMWLFAFSGLGFWVGVGAARHFPRVTGHSMAFLLEGGVAILVIAGLLCFSAYREFAGIFAQTVWRDFSACVAYGPKTSPKADSGDSD
jgi:hypothetical protein